MYFIYQKIHTTRDRYSCLKGYPWSKTMTFMASYRRRQCFGMLRRVRKIPNSRDCGSAENRFGLTLVLAIDAAPSCGGTNLKRLYPDLPRHPQQLMLELDI